MRKIAAVSIVLLLLAAAKLSSAIFTSWTLSEPHTPKLQIIGNAFAPKYQMASPHRSMLKSFSEGLFPTALAAECDCTEVKQKDPSCYCPICVPPAGQPPGPCVEYICATTNNTSKKCELWQDNFDPCVTQHNCKKSRQVSCTKPRSETCPGGICR